MRKGHARLALHLLQPPVRLARPLLLLHHLLLQLILLLTSLAQLVDARSQRGRALRQLGHQPALSLLRLGQSLAQCVSQLGRLGLLRLLLPQVPRVMVIEQVAHPLRLRRRLPCRLPLPRHIGQQPLQLRLLLAQHPALARYLAPCLRELRRLLIQAELQLLRSGHRRLGLLLACDLVELHLLRPLLGGARLLHQRPRLPLVPDLELMPQVCGFAHLLRVQVLCRRKLLAQRRVLAFPLVCLRL